MPTPRSRSSIPIPRARSRALDLKALVGVVNGATTTYTITNSCFIDTATGTLGTPLTSAQLKLQSSYAGWSFSTIWKMGAKHSQYPSLVFELASFPEMMPDV
ncbi:MAG TPA: hypothetical protein VHM25_29010, partial [Polyangiaceae bacterium]|nr:hypothetical protein [Polyangiaceae bacterium]